MEILSNVSAIIKNQVKNHVAISVVTMFRFQVLRNDPSLSDVINNILLCQFHQCVVTMVHMLGFATGSFFVKFVGGPMILFV